MNMIKLSLLSLLVISVLVGCGGAKVLTPQQQEELNLFDVSKIDELGVELHKGIDEDELLFYAPVSIEDAKDFYEDAKEEEDKGKKMSAYLSAKASLANAYETKSLVKKYLDDTADLDRRMKKQQTDVVFTSRYNDFREDYMDLIVMIDKAKVTEALEDKVKFMEEANDLYGDAVVYQNINEAKKILDNLKDNDLHKLIPIRYAKATKLYESSRLSIKQDPDNTQLVEKLSRETIEAAIFAQTLANDVVALSELKKDEYEVHFLKLHKRIATLNPDEANNPILPYPINEKVRRLKDMIEAFEPLEDSLKSEQKVAVEASTVTSDEVNSTMAKKATVEETALEKAEMSEEVVESASLIDSENSLEVEKVEEEVANDTTEEAENTTNIVENEAVDTNINVDNK